MHGILLSGNTLLFVLVLDIYHFGLNLCRRGEMGREKREIRSKERLQQLLTKHDMRMSTESSFTYADILQRIFQR